MRTALGPVTMMPTAAVGIFFLFSTALGVAPTASAQDRRPPPPRATTIGQMPTSTSDTDTGYIDNAMVGTRFRIRYDFGSDIDKPDRAEFFYAKCGCFGAPNVDAPGPIGTPVDADGNGTITMSELLASPLIENSLDYQEIRFDFEYAFRPNFSVFFELPYRQLDGAAIPSASGFGDFRAGLKYAMINERDRVLTFQLRAYFATGEADDGLGTDHESAEPALLYFQRLSPVSTFTGELRYWLPIDGSSGAGTGLGGDYAGDVVRWGLGYSRDIKTRTATVTPIVELVGWSVLDGISATSPDRTPNSIVIEKADETIVNLKLGLRWKLDEHHSFYLGYGKALTNEVWYDDIVRFEYRKTQNVL